MSSQNKLKVAILEDNKTLLKDAVDMLRASEHVELVVYSTNSEEFITLFKKKKPEALILDIDLVNDSMSGLDVAKYCKLPVLFLSGKISTYYSNIEDLDLDSEGVISHVSKPVTEEKLEKALSKFVRQYRAMQKTNYVHLDFAGTKNNKIRLDDIVCLCTDKKQGATSGNKVIYFNNRNPEVLVDFSFKDMDKFGLSTTKLITTHRSFRVNADHIKCYNTATHEVQVECLNDKGETSTKHIQVSENYRKEVRKFRM